MTQSGTMQIQENPSFENVLASNNFVSVAFKKSIGRQTVEALMDTVRNGELTETEDSFIISAHYLRFTRSDTENITGKLSDVAWRMMFVNREGDVREFNNFVFEIGVPAPAEDETTISREREYTQINTRIDNSLKEEMDTVRKLLNLSQTEFIAQAIAELVNQVKGAL